jgi:hypothetical protein
MKLALRWLWRIVPWLILILLFLLAFRASRAPVDALWLDAPGWSRARLVGNTQSEQAVPIALDDAGQVYLLLFPPELGGARPRVLALDRQADALWEYTFDTAFAEPTHPQLLWDGAALALFWLSDGQLYSARLDLSGALLSEPRLLSGATEVESYAAVAGIAGRIAVWYGGSRQAPGVYALSGDFSAPAALVDPAGIRPALRFDGAGALHAIWVADASSEERVTQIAYAAYPAGFDLAVPSTLVTQIAGNRAGADLDGPWLGLDQRDGYLLWTATAPRSGASYTQYVMFPLEAPAQASEIQALAVPARAGLDYMEVADGGLAAGPRLLLSGQVGGPITGIATNAAFDPELVVAFASQQGYKSNQIVAQVGALFWQDGAPSAYQLLSFTPDNSLTPTLVSDSARHLYATWREVGQAGFRVYFAGTSPELVQALRPLTRGDLARMVVDTVFGLLTGAIIAPIAAFGWLIAPLAVLGLTWFLRRNAEQFMHWGVLASLAAALIAYWAGKLAVFGDNLGYVPFSAWVPVIPPWLGLPLRIAIPLLTLAAGLRVAWRLTYGADRRSVLLFLLAYAAVDSVITMAIYGGLILGSF